LTTIKQDVVNNATYTNNKLAGTLGTKQSIIQNKNLQTTHAINEVKDSKYYCSEVQ